MVGHACTIAYPERINAETDQWEKIGEGRKILFFATEMEKEEIQTMILAYLSNVNEDKILRNTYENPREKEKVFQAIEIMTKYADNFVFVRVGDPSVGQVKALIRQQVLRYNIEYVFYDYIFSSPGLLNEYKDLHLREDVILMLLSTALKDLSNELDVFIMSGTQLNDKWKEWKGIRDYGLIRGAKAIVDKVDVAGISLPLTSEEHQQMDIVARKLDLDYPTQVQDLYKVRRGKYNRVRIWSKVDLGTCRVKDLFLTDLDGNMLNLIYDEYVYKETETETKPVETSINMKNLKKVEEGVDDPEKLVRKINKTPSLKDLI